MILVDPGHMLLKTSPVPDPLAESVLSLDDEIKRILASSEISERAKVLKYDQALQKYLTRVDQTNSRQWSQNVKPSPSMALQESSTEGAEKTVKFENRLIDSLPKTLQNKGRVLLAHLKEGTDLNWNNRGELVIKGQEIPGSNVSDLIHETLRARKLGTEPTGWKIYADILRQSNVPSDLIGNKVRWEASAIEASPFKSPHIVQKKTKKQPSKKHPKEWLSY